MARIFKEAPTAELVVKDAQELANSVAGNEATRTQLRRFYQEYVQIRQGIPRNDEEAYKRYEVPLKMLIAKAAYAGGRQVSIPNEFICWIQKNITAITCSEDVHNFGDYFEAFMGYFYGSGNRGSERRGQGGQGQNRPNKGGHDR